MKRMVFSFSIFPAPVAGQHDVVERPDRFSTSAWTKSRISFAYPQVGADVAPRCTPRNENATFGFLGSVGASEMNVENALVITRYFVEIAHSTRHWTGSIHLLGSSVADCATAQNSLCPHSCPGKDSDGD